jgi:hypothetical protein
MSMEDEAVRLPPREDNPGQERRVFKIKVGHMPRAKAEEYIGELVAKYRESKADPNSTVKFDEYVSGLVDKWGKIMDGKDTTAVIIESKEKMIEVDPETFQPMLGGVPIEAQQDASVLGKVAPVIEGLAQGVALSQ